MPWCRDMKKILHIMLHVFYYYWKKKIFLPNDILEMRVVILCTSILRCVMKDLCSIQDLINEYILIHDLWNPCRNHWTMMSTPFLASSKLSHPSISIHYWSLPFFFHESFMLQYVGFYTLIHSLSWGVVEKFSALPRWNSKINSDDWSFAHVLEIGSNWELFILLYMSRENKRKKKTSIFMAFSSPIEMFA